MTAAFVIISSLLLTSCGSRAGVVLTPRRSLADPECQTEVPVWREVSAGHWVSQSAAGARGLEKER